MRFFEGVFRHSSQSQWGRHILPDAMRGVRRGRLGEPGVPLESVGGYDTDPFVTQDVPEAQTQVNLDEIVQRSDTNMANLKQAIAPQTISEDTDESLKSWTDAIEEASIDISDCLGLKEKDIDKKQEVEVSGDIQKGIDNCTYRLEESYRRLKRALAALDEIKISVQGN